MLHTNQKFERCERRNNEVITLPFLCITLTSLEHLHNATFLMDLVSIASIDIRATQHYQSVCLSVVVKSNWANIQVLYSPVLYFPLFRKMEQS